MTQAPTGPKEAVAVISPGQHALRHVEQWSNRDAQLIGGMLAPGLDEKELRLYSKIADRLNKDPYRSEIHAWKSGGKVAIHVGIAGLRKDAEETGEYLGVDGPEFTDGSPCAWCEGKGVAEDRQVCAQCHGDGYRWRETWIDDVPPKAARAGVRRRGAEPTWVTLSWREWERTQKRTGARGPTLWDERPSYMLGMRAEYQSHKRAFPYIERSWSAALAELGLSNVVMTDELPPVGGGSQPASLAAPEDSFEADHSDPEHEHTSEATIGYPWETELREEMDRASLDVEILAGVVGSPLTFYAIDEWLSADASRTPKSLVSAAADAAAKAQEARRK